MIISWGGEPRSGELAPSSERVLFSKSVGDWEPSAE
jgi:hypothetical protein